MLIAPRPAPAPGGAAERTGRRVTSGGGSGTSGGAAARWERLVLAGFAAFAAVNAVANTQTAEADRARFGLPALGWEVWLWELSSFAAFALLLWPVLAGVRRLAAMRWPAALALLALGSVAFSLLHVLTMLGVRQLGYAVVGETYDFFHGRPLAVLVYEYRKDVMAYAGLVGLLLLVRRLAADAAPASVAAPAPAAPARIEVRDGARTVWLDPAELVLAEAAGNYVELHLARGGTLLHRTTLAALEAELTGFVRIHRSRLVRRAAVAEIRSTPSGDFELMLEGGRMVTGSRRFRDRLDSAPAIR